MQVNLSADHCCELYSDSVARLVFCRITGAGNFAFEETQATLNDIFDEEAGLAVTIVDDVEEVTINLRAYKIVH